jgi:hypothetical protein
MHSPDWSRAAVPQPDQYDARLALDLASTTPSPLRDELYTRPPVGEAPSLFDGRVAVRYCYPQWLYPGFVDAPADHPHLGLAAELLSRWPLAHEQFCLLIDTVHPLLAPGDPHHDPDHFGYTRSHGEEHMFGSLMASVNSPVMLAECFLHEMAHHKLRAFGVSFEAATRLVVNAPDELYESPLRKDQPRPMTAVLHAMYALTYMTELDLRILEREAGGNRMPRLLRRLGTNLGRLEEGRPVLESSLRLDREGEAFAAPYHAWVEDIVERGRFVLGQAGAGPA